jgi:RNA polymerase sigma factor (sigma-70 family)
MSDRLGVRPLHAVRSCAAMPQRAPQDPTLVAVVAAARAGDDAAWTELVRRFDRRLRNIARSYRLSGGDIDDVVQMTWLDAFRNLDALREPAAIGAFLATIACRNALRALQRPVREQPSGNPRLGDDADWNLPETHVFTAERRDALAQALASLPERHRRLMTVLATRPALDYREIGRLLDMPVGSIGPIRMRCLVRLRAHGAMQALDDTHGRESGREPSRLTAAAV